MKRLVLGTRGSPLAMWQAHWVAQALRRAAGVEAELKVITTRGDRLLDADAPAAGKGLFTKELERALLAGEIDLAVHSLKDLPVDSPAGLLLGAVPLREDPADVLVSRQAASLEDLPRGSAVLCGSPRRRAQVLARRPDLDAQPVRGNIHTRLAKFDASSTAGMILARAALTRLGLEDRIRCRLDPADFLPAPGQGALAIQCRADGAEPRRLAEDIDDARAHAATACERAVLEGLGGGCRMPIGAYARLAGDGAALVVTALAAAPDGSQLVKATMQAPCEDLAAARALGLKLAEHLKAAGAEDILRQLASPREDSP
ncbi:MAG: hydroxymethylbilane synthase [Phycisphaerae bacterium]|nr:hydroxymethylbilane synthase [Phycisphaerae bacterium]